MQAVRQQLLVSGKLTAMRASILRRDFAMRWLKNYEHTRLKYRWRISCARLSLSCYPTIATAIPLTGLAWSWWGTLIGALLPLNPGELRGRDKSHRSGDSEYPSAEARDSTTIRRDGRNLRFLQPSYLPDDPIEEILRGRCLGGIGQQALEIRLGIVKKTSLQIQKALYKPVASNLFFRRV